MEERAAEEELEGALVYPQAQQFVLLQWRGPKGVSRQHTSGWELLCGGKQTHFNIWKNSGFVWYRALRQPIRAKSKKVILLWGIPQDVRANVSEQFILGSPFEIPSSKKVTYHTAQRQNTFFTLLFSFLLYFMMDTFKPTIQKLMQQKMI